jgi:solute carrier family 7 (L-type amino acid transporter), member 8
MGDENESNKPFARKSSVVNGENNGTEVINNNNDGGEVTLKAKMSLLNGCTVIVGSIIGKSSGKRLCHKHKLVRI